MSLFQHAAANYLDIAPLSHLITHETNRLVQTMSVDHIVKEVFQTTERTHAMSACEPKFTA